MGQFDFTKEIDWNDEKKLRNILKNDLDVKPAVKIDDKCNQIIDYMTSNELRVHLDYFNIGVTNEIVPQRKHMLKCKVNGIEEEEESISSKTFTNNCQILTRRFDDTASLSDSSSLAYLGTKKDEEVSENISKAPCFVNTPNRSLKIPLSPSVSRSVIESPSQNSAMYEFALRHDYSHVYMTVNNCVEKYDTSSKEDMLLVTRMYKSVGNYNLKWVKKAKNTSMLDSSLIKKQKGDNIYDNSERNKDVSVSPLARISYLNKKRKVDNISDKIEGKSGNVLSPLAMRKLSPKILSKSPMKNNIYDKMPLSCFKYNVHTTEEYHLSVKVTKPLDAFVDDENYGMSLQAKYFGVSFELFNKQQSPVFWIKMDKICQMMKSLENVNAPDWMNDLDIMCVRKHPGGISIKKTENLVYDHYQIFLLKKLDVSVDIDEYVNDMVDHFLQFLKMDHFKTIYMPILESMNKLHKTVQLSEDKFFSYLQETKALVVNDLSLNSFLLDDDISKVMNHMMGTSNIDVAELSEAEKVFSLKEDISENINMVRHKNDFE